jgi:hypothetical protein
MDVGFDRGTLVLNHLILAAWTVLFFPGGNPLALAASSPTPVETVVLAMWVVSVVGLAAIDAIALYRLFAGD